VTARVIAVHTVETLDGSPLVDVTVRCPLCEKPAVVSNVPAEGFHDWQAGRLIQNALPGLSAGERETLISGAHEECFDKAFPDAGDPYDIDPDADSVFPPETPEDPL
jgi:hypothetical protein